MLALRLPHDKKKEGGGGKKKRSWLWASTAGWGKNHLNTTQEAYKSLHAWRQKKYRGSAAFLRIIMLWKKHAAVCFKTNPRGAHKEEYLTGGRKAGDIEHLSLFAGLYPGLLCSQRERRDPRWDANALHRTRVQNAASLDRGAPSCVHCTWIPSYASVAFYHPGCPLAFVYVNVKVVVT